jgi:putative aldouronate transport system substrate-binding protein
VSSATPVAGPIQLPPGVLDGRKWVFEPLVDPAKTFNDIHISINFAQNASAVYIKNDTPEDNVWSRFFKAMTGITYDPKWTAQGDEAIKQKWAASLASGDIPEFMMSNYAGGASGFEEFGQLFEAGMIEDITDVWMRAASDLTKQKKEYPNGNLWKGIVINGRIYGIPWTGGGVAENDMLLWVRQDWLNKVGLKPPTTLDEMRAVGNAFIKAGLAKMGIAGCMPLTTWMSAFDPVFGAFGVMPDIWLSDGSSGLVNGSILPGIKPALGVLRDWYADGVIDKEFVTLAPDKTAEIIGGNKVGMFFGPPWCDAWPLPDSRTNDPKADWLCLDVPAGPDGKHGRLGTNIYGAPSWFKKGTSADKIEAVIEHLNWWHDVQVKSQKRGGTVPYEGFVFEGYDYVVQKDSATGLDIVAEGPNQHTSPFYDPLSAVHAYPSMVYDRNNGYAWVKDYKGDYTDLNPAQRTWAMGYKQNPKMLTQAEGYARLIETKDWQIFNHQYGLPTKSMAELTPILNKLETQMQIDIITGNKPLDEFDNFVAQWKKQGGDVLTAEVNEWLKKQ